MSESAAVRVEALKKRFGSVIALDGVSFTVPRGTVLGLLGPNDAGKTTAVRILTSDELKARVGGDVIEVTVAQPDHGPLGGAGRPHALTIGGPTTRPVLYTLAWIVGLLHGSKVRGRR